MTITTPAPTATGYTLVHADPNELDITANVRTGVDITADPEFVASITAHGVLQAVSAVRPVQRTRRIHEHQDPTPHSHRVRICPSSQSIE